MELLVYSILVVVSLLGPNINGGLIENSSTNQAGVTYGRHVGNDSNTEAAETVCDEEKVIKMCQLKNAKCATAPEIPAGYVCYCDDGFEEINGICVEDLCKEKCGKEFVNGNVYCYKYYIDGIRVECRCKYGNKMFDYDTKTCIEKTECDEDTAIRKCKLKNAKCVLVPEIPAGYVCHCEDGFIERNGSCVEDKCKEKCGDNYEEDEISCDGDPKDVTTVTCTCKVPEQLFDYGTKKCKEKTACDETRAFEMCRLKRAACVVDTTFLKGFRCVCDIGYFEKNGICTNKTACDETKAFEKCRWKNATCVVDATAVEGFRCMCDIGYFEKNGVCTRDDKNEKVVIISPYLNVIALVLLLIVILLLLFFGICIIRMNQKIKAAINSVNGVK